MITLQVTPLQYDIIKAAVSAYTQDIMQVLEPKVQTVTITKGNASVTAEVPNYPPNAPRNIEAQWGLKKDGTPRARPGRKSTKVVRKARA
jgi:hypothetical protein